MKVFGFGLVGCGHIGRKHVEAIQKLPDARLIAVSDKNEQVLADYTGKYFCRGYEDYNEMFKDLAIDIVAICTPSGLHARMAIDALKAGKHVLVEKPMALSLREADAMIWAARKAKRKLGVVYPTRFNAAVRELRNAVEASSFGQFTHGSAAVRWNRNDEYYRQSPWRGTLSLDGGCLMNQAIHCIDLLQWMLGPVESVFGHTATKLRSIEAEDIGIALLKFKNGALGVVEAATTIYPSNLEEKLCLFGSTGSVVIGGKGFSNIATWRFPGENDESCAQNQTQHSPEGHLAVVEDFIEAVATGREPMANGAEGRKALEIVLAIYHSAKTKLETNLPLEEEFTIGAGMA
jgi:UDP-N-acetyl-2-amino-2-deoxyglucuronate dehydrogenase